MNFVYVGQSLDGYIAGPNGELDWLDEIDNPEKDDFGYDTFMKKVDALIMGKNTFEKVMSFGMWPYKKPVFVASNSLSSLPHSVDGKAFLIKGTPAEMAQILNKNGFTNLYIDGGALIQSFIKEGLIDKIIVTTLPIILGEGVSLFSNLPNRINLKLVGSEVLLNQLVKTQYEVEKS